MLPVLLPEDSRTTHSERSLHHLHRASLRRLPHLDPRRHALGQRSEVRHDADQAVMSLQGLDRLDDRLQRLFVSSAPKPSSTKRLSNASCPWAPAARSASRSASASAKARDVRNVSPPLRVFTERSASPFHPSTTRKSRSSAFSGSGRPTAVAGVASRLRPGRAWRPPRDSLQIIAPEQVRQLARHLRPSRAASSCGRHSAARAMRSIRACSPVPSSPARRTAASRSPCVRCTKPLSCSCSSPSPRAASVPSRRAARSAPRQHRSRASFATHAARCR